MLAQRSFALGKFTLSSGAASDYYVDCRTTTLHAEGSRLTARVISDLIADQRWKPQGVGGMTLGADPIVTGVAILSAQQVQIRKPARTKDINVEPFLVHGFLVRKAEKAHGTAQRIEGFRQKGARVVIVDDVCTTGASTIQAIEAAREFGFEVVGVVCLVERQDAGGRAAVEAAAGAAPFVAIFTAAEVRKEYLALKAAGAGAPSAPVEGSCDLCGEPAFISVPGKRCVAHAG
jgi:orotate phosphoribosyltransferase